MERKNTDQLQQELMTGNDLDRVLADNDSSFQGYALQELSLIHISEHTRPY